MVNKTNCLFLADTIEKLEPSSLEDEKGFNMIGHTHHCGTPACISGWAAYLALGRYPNIAGDIDIPASEFLGIELDENRLHDLFYPKIKELWVSITPKEAAKVIRHLGETGECDWTVAGKTRFKDGDVD